MKSILTFSTAIFLFTFSAFTQEPPSDKNEYFFFKLKSGESYAGKEISRTDSTLTAELENGAMITLPLAKIKRIDPAVMKDGKIRFPNPNATRNLYGPTGYGLKKGEGYYQNTYLFLNSVSYGFTDFFTIGGGFEILSLSAGEPIFFLTPKFSFPVSEKVNFGAGLLYLNAGPLSDDNYDMGITYGVGTFGTRENNFTIGLGYGFIEGEIGRRPVITFSGMSRIGKKFGLVSENWVVPYQRYIYTPNGLELKEYAYEAVFSLGLRYMTPKLTIDFALVGNDDIMRELFFGIPYLDIVIPFGKR